MGNLAAQASSEIEDSLYTICHDLKEPIRGANIYLSFIQSEFGHTQSSEQTRYFNRLHELAEALTAKLTSIERYNSAIVRGIHSKGSMIEANNQFRDFLHTIGHSLTEPSQEFKQHLDGLKLGFEQPMPAEMADLFQRLLGVTNNLLAKLSSLDRLHRVLINNEKIGPVSLNKLLPSVIEKFHQQNKFDAFEIELPQELPTITGNGERLTLIFQEILANALEFNDEKPKIVSVEAINQPVNHLFKIKDNGRGMAQRYHERVFQIFRSAQMEKLTGGRGVGLTLVKKIVERNGGEVWLESAEEEGTTVIFTWPHTH